MHNVKSKLLIKAIVVSTCIIILWFTLCPMILTKGIAIEGEGTRSLGESVCYMPPTPSEKILVVDPSLAVSINNADSLDVFRNPYAELDVTDFEKELLARMVYNEARGEPFEGQIAVVQVALNRYMHEAFHGSISDILLAPYQFSVGSTYGEEQMEAVEAALAGEPVLDLNTDVVFFSAGSLTYGSYYKTIGGHVFRTYS